MKNVEETKKSSTDTFCMQDAPKFESDINDNIVQKRNKDDDAYCENEAKKEISEKDLENFIWKQAKNK